MARRAAEAEMLEYGYVAHPRRRGETARYQIPQTWLAADVWCTFEVRRRYPRPCVRCSKRGDVELWVLPEFDSEPADEVGPYCNTECVEDDWVR